MDVNFPKVSQNSEDLLGSVPSGYYLNLQILQMAGTVALEYQEKLRRPFNCSDIFASLGGTIVFDYSIYDKKFWLKVPQGGSPSILLPPSIKMLSMESEWIARGVGHYFLHSQKGRRSLGVSIGMLRGPATVAADYFAAMLDLMVAEAHYREGVKDEAFFDRTRCELGLLGYYPPPEESPCLARMLKHVAKASNPRLWRKHPERLLDGSH
jgi:hypothetical protein